jgi:photosystem II stability/assembly factor-like uncharacterized protein
LKNRTSKHKLTITKGNHQTGEYNTPLPDSLVVSITQFSGQPVQQATIQFSIKEGNGKISHEWVFTDSIGHAAAKWTLGCDNEYQEITAYLCDSLAHRIDSVNFEANATIPYGWNKACSLPEYEVTSIAKHPNGKIYAAFHISNTKLFVSNDGGVNWTPLEHFPEIDYIQKIQIQEDGDIFVATQDNGILRSTNNGLSWHSCNTGINDVRYFKDLVSVSNETIFYSTYMGSLHISNDNGTTWKSLKNELPNRDQYSQVTKHPDGTLYLINDVGDVFQSNDAGNHWEIKRFSITSSVSAIHFDKEGVLYIGVNNYYQSIFCSKDKGETWEKLFENKEHNGCYMEITRITDHGGDIYFHSACKGIYRIEDNLCKLITENIMVNNKFLVLSENEILAGGYNGLWYNLDLE